MKSVQNWIYYLHENSWIFSPPLAILFNFLNSKIDLDFQKLIIQNPFRILISSYEESCSPVRDLQKHVLLKKFLAQEGPFWIGQSLKRFELNLNSFKFQI
jgi:hypothetical protein